MPSPRGRRPGEWSGTGGRARCADRASAGHPGDAAADQYHRRMYDLEDVAITTSINGLYEAELIH